MIYRFCVHIYVGVEKEIRERDYGAQGRQNMFYVGCFDIFLFGCVCCYIGCVTVLSYVCYLSNFL